MLFVVDIGNSHTVVGCYAGEHLQGQWRLKSDRYQTPDEIAIQFHALFTMANLDIKAISGIIISSVVPSLEAAWSTCCARHFSTNLKNPPFIVSADTLKDLIQVKTDYPEEVGADRLVNGIAGWAQYRSTVIVIDFGTAITFDCITADCEYIGGTILPGVAISLEALSSRAAKLPHIDITSPPHSVIGKNTVQAMKSGILHGYGAMVDGLIAVLGREMGTEKPSLKVLATGGMAAIVIPYSTGVDMIDPMLTLKGLQIIYSRIYDTPGNR